MNVIEVKNLTKNFGTFTAVDNITFEVEEGTIFGLLGPNGAGKTTTIECMIGLKKPTEGSLRLLDMDVLKAGKELYDYIGVQLQETAYQDKIKVYELCDLFTAMYKQPLDYRLLLEKFGLQEKAQSYIHDLSGGQKQKVAIILALIANPKVVVLDELTTGLDPKARREMWDLVKGLKEEGRTVFLTTHYMEEAAYLCDKIGIIDSGRLLVDETVRGVIMYAQLEHEVNFVGNGADIGAIKAYLEGHFNRTISIKYEEGITYVYSNYEDIISDVILTLRDLNLKYTQINIVRPSLEDAYLKLTGKAWEV